MIKQGGQNIKLLFTDAKYKQCKSCKFNRHSICIAPLNGLIAEVDIKGECSGYRWSFIKWIKHLPVHIFVKVNGKKLTKVNPGFHSRNVMGNMFNKIKW